VNTFSWNTTIPVQKMEGAGLADASLLDTFAAVRLAMLAAFVDQLSKVQALCQSGNSESNRSEAGILTPKALGVAHHVDQLVSGAAPQLVVTRLAHAWSIVEKLWPDNRSAGTDNTYAADYLPTQRIATRASELGLSSCPLALLIVLFDMLETFKENGLSCSSTAVPDDWAPYGTGKLETMYRQAPSFGIALERFSLALYDRPLEATKRTKYAIEQASELLAAMRFCHLIIITQLDLPQDWYCKISFRPLAYIISPLVSLPTGLYVPPAFTGTTLLAFMAIIAAGAGVIDLASYYWTRPADFASPEYTYMLSLSIDILDIPSSSSVKISEKLLSGRLARDSDPLPNLKLLEEWRDRLKLGLKNHMKPGSGWILTPTLQWAKWLFDAARVGRLREVLSSEFRIGVEGPVKAGKSELLTVLANAPSTVFNSGEDGEHRTMGIQMYQPIGTNTIFIDCPGVDDREPEIQTMGRMVRDMLSVVIFVFPVTTEIRTEAAYKWLKEVAEFLSSHDSTSDYRPVRILLSNTDELKHNPYDPLKVEAYRRRQPQYKADFIEQLMELGKFCEGFKVLSRRRCQDMTLVVAESLEEVVQLYSNHAQVSADRKALCDYENSTGVRRAIWHPDHFEVVNDMV